MRKRFLGCVLLVGVGITLAGCACGRQEVQEVATAQTPPVYVQPAPAPPPPPAPAPAPLRKARN